MRVVLNTNLNFQRRLRPEEKADFSAVLNQAKQKVGNTGHSILIAPSISFPGGVNKGVGNILTKEGREFVDFAKQYWGINYLQLLPEGICKFEAGKCLPYSGSSLDLGAHLIDLELLTKKEYAEILSTEDLKALADFSKPPLFDNYVLYEKILPRNSATQGVLKKAYNELLKADTPEKKQLLEEFKEFKQANKEWLEPKAVFEALTLKNKTDNIEKWCGVEKNLYNNDKVSVSKRNSIISKIFKSENGKEAEFFEFKQFLASQHLAKAKAELNNKGIKLGGDVVVGFSPDEIWANSKAFKDGYSVGWGLPALDFDSPEAEKLLRRKMNLNAKRYDGLRIDASWIYSCQPLSKNGVFENKIDFGSKILDIIDDEILKVKGVNYNKENIMHEFLVDPEVFNIFENSRLKPFIEDRVKIITSDSMNHDWATVNVFRNRGWKEGSYILGATNHDCMSMKIKFAEFSARDEQAKFLSESLKIPKANLKSETDFIKAKFAEPMRSKHNMMFFVDALGLEGLYKNSGKLENDYRLKIPSNYQEGYFNALKKGEGFNAMDALEKAFVAEGLDKKEPELYKKIIKYRKILQEPENALKGTPKILYATLALLGTALLAIALSKVLANKKAD